MNNPLLDSFIKHQINIDRFSNYEAQRLLKILDQAIIQAKDIVSKTNGIETKARYERVLSNMRTLSGMLNEKLYEIIESDFKGLARIETQFISKVLKANGITVNLEMPPVEKLWAAASNDNYADTHEKFKDYINGLSKCFYETWSTNIRAGWLNGMTAAQITRNVLGSVDNINLDAKEMKKLRNSLKMNSKTMIAEMATTARHETYNANSSLFSGYRYIGVLDDRQCLLCGSMDQRLFKTLGDMPHLPQHRSCRCIALPEVRGLENYDPDDTRAAMDGPEKASTSYADWLAKQDAETQKDILGKSRYELYKNGLPITKFIDNGKMIKLKDLEKNL